MNFRKHIRWREWDYSSPGMYFIETFIAVGSAPLGEVLLHEGEPLTGLNDIGRKVQACWQDIPAHYPFVTLDDFAILPDQLVGILHFDKPVPVDFQPNRFGPQRDNLAVVIGSFKSTVTRWANQCGLPFGWQLRYRDRVIRDTQELAEYRGEIRDKLNTLLRLQATHPMPAPDRRPDLPQSPAPRSSGSAHP